MRDKRNDYQTMIEPNWHNMHILNSGLEGVFFNTLTWKKYG